MVPQYQTLTSFHQKEPAALAKLQDQHWRPILDWAQSTYDIEVSTTDSFLLDPHPVETYEKLDELLSGFDSWEMAGESVRLLHNCR